MPQRKCVLAMRSSRFVAITLCSPNRRAQVDVFLVLADGDGSGGVSYGVHQAEVQRRMRMLNNSLKLSGIRPVAIHAFTSGPKLTSYGVGSRLVLVNGHCCANRRYFGIYQAYTNYLCGKIITDYAKKHHSTYRWMLRFRTDAPPAFMLPPWKLWCITPTFCALHTKFDRAFAMMLCPFPQRCF